MSYLVASELPSEPAGRRFRALVEGGGIARLPGAHNGMAALQAKAAGFEGLYLSGAAMTDMTAVSFSITIEKFVIGGSMVRTACGMMMYFIARAGVIPRDSAASICPRWMASIPAR